MPCKQGHADIQKTSGNDIHHYCPLYPVTMKRKSRLQIHLTNKQRKSNEERALPNKKQAERPVEIKQTETATAGPKARREPVKDNSFCNVCKKKMYTKNLKRHHKNSHDIEILYTAVCCEEERREIIWLGNL